MTPRTTPIADSGPEACVSVIIAAYNAEATIERAVRSALSQGPTKEVLVVDDASKDGTVEVARRAAEGDPRLKVIVQAHNTGPSRARNRALDAASATYVAVLDADDQFLPGRLDRLLAVEGWDFIADNIVFCEDFAHLDGFLTARAADLERVQAKPVRSELTFETFVLGNVPVKDRSRGELGFLKPLMRLDFLNAYGLRYCETCRLGEDFLLYARALAVGARFAIEPECGYAALIRSQSLSSHHSLSDLRAFRTNSASLGKTGRLSAKDRTALNAHMQGLQKRIAHREVLDIRHRRGIVSGLAAAFTRPSALMAVLRDRVGPPPAPPPLPRTLLDSARNL